MAKTTRASATAARADRTAIAATASAPIVSDLPLYLQLQRIGGKLTPQEVSSILQQADSGYTWRLVDLANKRGKRIATSTASSRRASSRWRGSSGRSSLAAGQRGSRIARRPSSARSTSARSPIFPGSSRTSSEAVGTTASPSPSCSTACAAGPTCRCRRATSRAGGSYSIWPRGSCGSGMRPEALRRRTPASTCRPSTPAASSSSSRARTATSRPARGFPASSSGRAVPSKPGRLPMRSASSKRRIHQPSAREAGMSSKPARRYTASRVRVSRRPEIGRAHV